MIPHTLSLLWTQAASAMGNHLWQSTLVAAIAGLLTLALRKNHARARYWLWMAASVKFLIPFSWLIAIGSRLSWSHPTAANDGLYVVIDEVSQPFTRNALAVAPVASPIASLLHVLPALLAGVWFCGFAAVLLVWCVRWRRISATLRSAVPLHEGREVEALRRLEQASGVRTRIQLLLSRAMLEPGIFGMTRPVLVWPEGISERLENPHLEAILAHELWHVRRRDNLAAALHMLVEAVFWFHPLVWWLGARLIDERERACDEDVLEFGSERHVYAESILKVCEFCVGSPLACVSGVTGADLKKRMVHIMSERVIRQLDFSRKLLLSAVATLAIAVPIIFGLTHATPGHAQEQSVGVASTAPQFDSVSFKPSPSEPSSLSASENKPRAVRMMFSPEGYRATGVTMRSLIQEAYGLQANQVLGGPEWLDSIAYDLDASAKNPDQAKMHIEPDGGFEHGMLMQHERMQHMLQRMLADHTRLALHSETKDLPNYVLSVGEGGAKLQPAQNRGAETITNRGGDTVTVDRQIKLDGEGHAIARRGIFMQSADGPSRTIAGQGLSTEGIARQLSMMLGVNVTDRTGLHGEFDFTLQWQADSPESLISAVQEQIGLKLQQQTAPTQVLVIDHIEKPEEVTSASR